MVQGIKDTEAPILEINGSEAIIHMVDLFLEVENTILEVKDMKDTILEVKDMEGTILEAIAPEDNDITLGVKVQELDLILEIGDIADIVLGDKEIVYMETIVMEALQLEVMVDTLDQEASVGVSEAWVGASEAWVWASEALEEMETSETWEEIVFLLWVQWDYWGIPSNLIMSLIVTIHLRLIQRVLTAL